MPLKTKSQGPKSKRVRRATKPEANSIYHVSIAVIKRQVNDTAIGDEAPKYDYLVLQEDGSDYHFLDTPNRAIGAGYDHTAMKARIVEYFQLEEQEFSGTDFFRENRSDPNATAYTFLLSSAQAHSISLLIEHGELKGKALWIPEAKLASKRNRWGKSQLFLFEKDAASFVHPKFSAELRLDLTNIVKARNQGKLVVFAGAGVSVDSSVPGWGALMKELRSDLGETRSDADPLITAQHYLNARKKKEYIERIQELLKHPDTKSNPLHEVILDLQPQHIITTNFDQHFEQAIRESSSRYSVVRKDGDLPYAKGASLFVKMHGDLDEHNIVFTKKDYEDYETNFPLIESFVKYVFSSSLVLFVGFSFTDPNLKEILEKVENILGANHQLPYFLTFSRGARNKLAQQVRVVEVGPKSVEEYYASRSRARDAEQLKKLSKQGQQVYKFLRVVHRWDLFSDTLARTDVAKQLQLSLKRFNEFVAIPVDVITRLIPLRLNRGLSKHVRSNDADYSPHEPFVLKTKNDELLRYLKRSAKQGIVQFTSEKGPLQEAPDAALRLLFNSGIRHIARASDTHPEVYELQPKKSDRYCECMSCRYQRLELADLLQDAETLASKNLCSAHRGDLGIQQSWVLFKLGQVTRSYYLLEEVRIRSQQAHQYVTYYLACLNLRSLRPFLHHTSNVSDDQLADIREAIADIDLERILNELPVDGEVKEALSSLRTSKPLDEARWQTLEEIEKVKEIHAGYVRGGYRTSGPVHWFKVEASTYNVYNLLRMNGLLDDEFGDFGRISQGYLDCMLVTWATPSGYTARPKMLSEFFAAMFCEYGDSEKLAERLNEPVMLPLVFGKKARSKIMERFNNLLRSGFERQKFWGNDLLKRPLFARACESEGFARRGRRWTNNHLLLLSAMELGEDEAKELMNLVLDFLTVSDCFGGANSHDAFLRFTRSVVKKLDHAVFERLLQYALSDHIWSGDILPELCESIRSTDHLFKASVGTYERVVARSTKRPGWHSTLEGMIPLHQFLVPDEQRLMKEALQLDQRQGHEGTELLWKSYYYGLWNPKEDRGIWGRYCEGLTKEVAFLKDYHIPDDGWPKDVENWGPWNGVRHCIRIAYEHDLRESPECHMIMENLKSKMYLWAFRPEAFDYREFNYRWLLAFDDWYLDRMPWPERMVSTLEDQLKKEFIPGVAKALYRHRTRKK